MTGTMMVERRLAGGGAAAWAVVTVSAAMSAPASARRI
jgi:hypothetical protein